MMTDDNLFSLATRGKTESQRLLLLATIGVVTALKNGLITIDEAEKYLFSPYSMKMLEECNFDQEIIDIIHIGTELENIDRLIPNHLPHSMEEMLNDAFKCLSRLPRSDFMSMKKWIFVEKIKIPE